jgi:hypothetical protein
MSPVRILKRVDLPLPFRPSKPMRSPTETDIWALSKIILGPKLKRIFFRVQSKLIEAIIEMSGAFGKLFPDRYITLATC